MPHSLHPTNITSGNFPTSRTTPSVHQASATQRAFRLSSGCKICESSGHPRTAVNLHPCRVLRLLKLNSTLPGLAHHRGSGMVRLVPFSSCSRPLLGRPAKTTCADFNEPSQHDMTMALTNVVMAMALFRWLHHS